MPRIRRTGDNTQIGRSASSGVGFFGAAPITQPTSANEAALTDSTGGTAATTLAAIAAGSSYAQSDLVAVKNAIASLARQTNQLRADMVALGLIKGS